MSHSNVHTELLSHEGCIENISYIIMQATLSCVHIASHDLITCIHTKLNISYNCEQIAVINTIILLIDSHWVTQQYLLKAANESHML